MTGVQTCALPISLGESRRGHDPPLLVNIALHGLYFCFARLLLLHGLCNVLPCTAFAMFCFTRPLLLLCTAFTFAWPLQCFALHGLYFCTDFAMFCFAQPIILLCTAFARPLHNLNFCTAFAMFCFARPLHDLCTAFAMFCFARPLHNLCTAFTFAWPLFLLCTAFPDPTGPHWSSGCNATWRMKCDQHTQ